MFRQRSWSAINTIIDKILDQVSQYMAKVATYAKDRNLTNHDDVKQLYSRLIADAKEFKDMAVITKRLYRRTKSDSESVYGTLPLSLCDLGD